MTYVRSTLQWRGFAKKLCTKGISLSHPDWDFNESINSQSLTAEAQKSLAVVLPGGTALSEIISCIRQKGVISTSKKGHLLRLIDTGGLFPCVFPPKRGTVRNHAIYCRLSIRFLSVPLFGAKTGRYTPFWRSPFFFFFFFVRKDPSSCDDTEIRTHVPTSEGFEVTNWTTGTTGFYIFL